jgi:hypothetical protein
MSIRKSFTYTGVSSLLVLGMLYSTDLQAQGSACDSGANRVNAVATPFDFVRTATVDFSGNHG